MPQQERSHQACTDPQRRPLELEVDQSDRQWPVPQIDGVRARTQPLREPAAGPRRALPPRQQNQSRAQRGQQRGTTRPACAGIDQHDGRDDEGDPQRLEQGRAATRRAQPPSQQKHETAEQQFPGAGLQQEEGLTRLAGAQHLTKDKGCQQHQDMRAEQRPSPRQQLDKHEQNQRINQVELPFDRQRPGMQQPLFMGGDIEVAGFSEITQVRAE
ncbi:hypothetical protein D3C81_1521130 [compost metagenome]